MRTHLLVAAALGMFGCTTDVGDPAEVAAALEHVEGVIHDFHVANEFNYYETRSYTGDFEALALHLGAPLSDSVVLRVLKADEDGYAVVGTHVRLGERIGCAMAWGNLVPLQTPGGVAFTGGNQILCDEVQAQSN